MRQVDQIRGGAPVIPQATARIAAQQAFKATIVGSTVGLRVRTTTTLGLGAVAPAITKKIAVAQGAS